MSGVGFYREVYRVEVAKITRDAFGQNQPEEWSTVGRVRGTTAFTPRETMDDLGSASRVDATIEMPWCPWLTRRARLVNTLTGEVYNLAAEPVDISGGRRQKMRVLATRVSA